MIGQIENGAGPCATRRVFRALGVAGVMVGLLGGCSSVPDYANPVAWYRGVFGEKKAEAPSAAPVPVPGASQPYPNLGTVPARPRDVSSAQERGSIQQGLLADRANAQYTDETLTPGGSTRPAAQPRPATPAAASPAAPPVAAAAPAPAVIAPPPVAPPTPAATMAPAPAQPTVSVPPPRSAATIGGAAPQAAAPSGGLPPTTAQTQTGMSRAQALVQALKTDSPTATGGQRLAPAAPASRLPAPAAASSSQPIPMSPPPAPAIVTPPPSASAAPPIAPQRPPLVAPAQSAAGTEAAYRQALAQSEAASQPPVMVPPQQAAASTLGMTLPRSRQVYDPRALATIPFVGGSTRLSNADLQTLREVAEIHQRRGGMLRIVGHARQEGAGNAANQQVTNFRVSGDRADAVAQALVRLGVSGAMMEVEAQGDGQPATTALGQPDPAASRRVEIYLDN